ncbi:unnamed protein product [Triticum turgidum subsp. durum]|uniref:Uncharacterized protein n=1 Tax=Triticum turgidum subsp. durum TaxID=4567 RepID=A0A9R1PZT2_TRITD|nr:unnamed protein product [Triticum turgidum subsp. durum]
MSFRSIEQLLRRNSKIKISQSIANGIHDQKEEQSVQALRESLLASNQLPEKFDDHHVLLRYLSFIHYPETMLYTFIHGYITKIIHLNNGRYFTPQQLWGQTYSYFVLKLDLI